MYERVKSKGRYVIQHSCGDIEEVFTDLIDIGLMFTDISARNIRYKKVRSSTVITLHSGEENPHSCAGIRQARRCEKRNN
jgi:hypothetical protein